MEQPTHIATKPNERPPTPLAVFADQLKVAHLGQVKAYFEGDKEKATKFMNAVIYSVQKNPKLLDCDRDSAMSAFMSCAEFGLYPSNVAGEAFIIPYKGKAQFQLGYQGLVTLLARGGISVTSNIVRKNDKFRYEEGLNPILEHAPDPFATDEQRGEPIGVYAILTNQHGQKVVKVMGREAVMKIKNLSQAKDSEYSPWNSKQDPELWMWRKTCIRQAAKLVPKTEKLQQAIEEDNKESIIRKNPLDAAGPAVGAANHSPQLPAGSPEAEEKVAGPWDGKAKTEDCPGYADPEKLGFCTNCGLTKSEHKEPVSEELPVVQLEDEPDIPEDPDAPQHP